MESVVHRDLATRNVGFVKVSSPGSACPAWPLICSPASSDSSPATGSSATKSAPSCSKRSAKLRASRAPAIAPPTGSFSARLRAAANSILVTSTTSPSKTSSSNPSARTGKLSSIGSSTAAFHGPPERLHFPGLVGGSHSRPPEASGGSRGCWTALPQRVLQLPDRRRQACPLALQDPADQAVGLAAQHVALDLQLELRLPRLRSRSSCAHSTAIPAACSRRCNSFCSTSAKKEQGPVVAAPAAWQPRVIEPAARQAQLDPESHGVFSRPEAFWNHRARSARTEARAGTRGALIAGSAQDRTDRAQFRIVENAAAAIGAGIAGAAGHA